MPWARPRGWNCPCPKGLSPNCAAALRPIIQTTVAISQGSSGGGLFNAEGELVGITTFYLKDSQSLNFALPVEWIGEVAGRKIRERPRGEAPGLLNRVRNRKSWTWQVNRIGRVAGHWT